ncbi:hypothetical protein J4573_52930 [Actinomadura barringtoniae]|uniref:Uncharacterized protein n=1 Tax=Actinomadura barringtoniae TaxID=1427535 RepID=A0A939PTB5_9ACTN|nr:hypothetical protein [Actinomadura barringtoniae]MBO2455864.1 hypothetical protein [Actinomadura barringtoniae]
MRDDFSVPASSDDNTTAYDSPLTLGAETKVDVLAEIVNDLLSTLVNEGRMSLAEERTWRAATDAVVLDKPELNTPGGQVVAEVETILHAA